MWTKHKINRDLSAESKRFKTWKDFFHNYGRPCDNHHTSSGKEAGDLFSCLGDLRFCVMSLHGHASSKNAGGLVRLVLNGFPNLAEFCGASFILSLAPGPDNIFVLMQSGHLRQIRRAEDCFGLCTGLLVHTLLVAVGVSALIRASETAFFCLKATGALYLTYLAVMAWKAPSTQWPKKRRS